MTDEETPADIYLQTWIQKIPGWVTFVACVLIVGALKWFIEGNQDVLQVGRKWCEAGAHSESCEGENTKKH